MYLSKLELMVLHQIANNHTDIIEIAKNLHRDKSRIYRTKNRLIEKNLIEFSQSKFIMKKTTHITLLLQLLTRHKNIIYLLSESGLFILMQLLHPKSVEEIEKITGFKKSIIYKKIKQGMNISAITQKEKSKYIINDKIWPDLKEFLEEYDKYDKTTDPRIPANSKIYYKNKEEIIFSNAADLEATLTGFSSYEKYGIKLMLTTNYYYLPNRSLTKKDILMHSLYIAQKDKNIRNITFVCLFYLKYNKDFLKIKNPMLNKIKQVLKGRKIKKYPTLDEIKEKAKVYDIKI